MQTDEILEINFIEPGLGLLVVVLENLERELLKQRLKNSRLTAMIQAVAETEDQFNFQKLQSQWNQLQSELLEVMLPLPSTNRLSLQGDLFKAQNLFFDLGNPDGFLNCLEKKCQNQEVNSLASFLETMKLASKSFFVQNFIAISQLPNFKNLPQEFQKMVQASCEVENYAEIEESQHILVNLFNLIPFSIKHPNLEIYEKIHQFLMANESRLDWLNLMNQNQEELITRI